MRRTGVWLMGCSLVAPGVEIKGKQENPFGFRFTIATVNPSQLSSKFKAQSGEFSH